jgi:hypothetical protein
MEVGAEGVTGQQEVEFFYAIEASGEWSQRRKGPMK